MSLPFALAGGTSVSAGPAAAGIRGGAQPYGSLQLSRNANPPPDPSWTDANRNWTLDNDDKTNNFTVFLDLLRAVRNTDIRFGYDYSDSDNSFAHGGPRIPALSALGQFIPLPNVTNTWHRASADVQYFFTARAGVGIGADDAVRAGLRHHPAGRFFRSLRRLNDAYAPGVAPNRRLNAEKKFFLLR